MYPGAHARTMPDKPAVIMAGGGETLTYKELDDQSNQLAQLLHRRGLRTGDGIALCMQNNAAYFPVLWAGQRSGLYYTAVSSRLTASEVEYIVDDCGSRVLILSHAKRELAEELAGRLPLVHTRLMVGGTIDGWESYEEVVGAMPAEPL